MTQSAARSDPEDELRGGPGPWRNDSGIRMFDGRRADLETASRSPIGEPCRAGGQGAEPLMPSFRIFRSRYQEKYPR
jgi:hypothetical protein